jgi:multidrug transporter EmrE-like cation transporter
VTFLTIFLCIVCQLFLIAGQLLLKRAMSPGEKVLAPSQRTTRFILGIASLTIWFFLWLGVLQQLPLSTAFPFEGLNPAMLAIGAWLVLKEQMPLKAWVGVALVCFGIVIVALS